MARRNCTKYLEIGPSSRLYRLGSRENETAVPGSVFPVVSHEGLDRPHLKLLKYWNRATALTSD
jgi:hypothetical protein